MVSQFMRLKLAPADTLKYDTYQVLIDTPDMYKHPYKELHTWLEKVNMVEILEFESIERVKSGLKSYKQKMRVLEIQEICHSLQNIYADKCILLSSSPWDSALTYSKILPQHLYKFLGMARTNSIIKPYQYMKKFNIKCIFCMKNRRRLKITDKYIFKTGTALLKHLIFECKCQDEENTKPYITRLRNNYDWLQTIFLLKNICEADWKNHRLFYLDICNAIKLTRKRLQLHFYPNTK